MLIRITCYNKFYNNALFNKNPRVNTLYYSFSTQVFLDPEREICKIHSTLRSCLRVKTFYISDFRIKFQTFNILE